MKTIVYYDCLRSIVTYGQNICDNRPQNNEPHQTRLVTGETSPVLQEMTVQKQQIQQHQIYFSIAPYPQKLQGSYDVTLNTYT